MVEKVVLLISMRKNNETQPLPPTLSIPGPLGKFLEGDVKYLHNLVVGKYFLKGCMYTEKALAIRENVRDLRL